VTTSKRYSPEVRERVVRLVLDQERDSGRREGPTMDERKRVKDLEREVRELRRANEILRKASA
jgi:transposase-like protein